MKKNNGSQITNLETNQANMGASLKTFPSDLENNPKDCMAITLRTGKELGDSKEVKNEKVKIEKEEVKWTRMRKK